MTSRNSILTYCVHWKICITEGMPLTPDVDATDSKLGARKFSSAVPNSISFGFISRS